MDSVNYSPYQTITRSVPRWLGSRVGKATIVAVSVVAAIGFYQFSAVDHTVVQYELFPNCQLRNQELHQIRIALSKSGLTDHQIRTGNVWVPASSHAQYLKVIVDQDLLPAELRPANHATAINNPFLTRSQQISIQHSQRKEKLEDLINRLPFVEQAWFEMDAPDSWTRLKIEEKQALVSVRSGPRHVLLDYQVQTIRELVAGAISGLASDNITVIDLDSGTAFQGQLELNDMSQRIAAQRQLVHRQRLIENRVREEVFELIGDTASVLVKMEPWSEELKSCQLAHSSQTNMQFEIAGSNEKVSLESIQADIDLQPIAGQQHSGDAFSSDRTCYRVHVTIELPFHWKETRLGQISVSAAMPDGGDSLQGHPNANSSKNKIDLNQSVSSNRITQEIERVIDLIEPAAAVQVDIIGPSPKAPVELTWQDRVISAGTDYWQTTIGVLASLLVLGLLFSGNSSSEIISQQEPTDCNDCPNDEITDAQREIQRDSMQQEAETTKAQLSKLIEQDPKLAAQAIEKWLRDVA